MLTCFKIVCLCQKHKVTWHKVKGHSDNEYNNRCDALAVNAIKELIKRRKTMKIVDFMKEI